MKLILEDVAPCRALYNQAKLSNGESLGVPIDRVDEPVLCLLENRAHTKGHRSNRRVRGGGKTVWQKVVGNLLPYSPAWEGPFDTGGVAAKASRALKSIDEMINDVIVLTNMSTGDYLTSLRMLQRAYSNNGVDVIFAPLSIEDVNEMLLSKNTSSNSQFLLMSPLEVKAEALSRDSLLMMPYCIGCADKVLVVHGENDNSQIATHDKKTTDTRKTQSGWLQVIVGSVLETVGLSSSENNRIVHGAPSELYDVPVHSVLEGPIATQTVTFGFCGKCLNLLLELKK
jgi:hypothetical protein